MSRPPDAFFERRAVLPSKVAHGFSLIELLVTVVVLGIVAGMVIGLTGGAQATSETKMIQSELAEIRKACQRFKIDMGVMPYCLAELIRSPDTTAVGGGWVSWRTQPNQAIDSRLYSYDPATSRGWNGPYLQPKTADAQYVGTRFREKRILTVSPTRTCETITFPNANGPAPILFSHYVTQVQSKVAESDGSGTAITNYSHYELDFSDASEIAVIFVSNPESEPSDKPAIARLGLGIKP